MDKPEWCPNAGDRVLIEAEVVRSYDGFDGVYVMVFCGGQQLEMRLADLLPAPDRAAPTVEDYKRAAVKLLRETWRTSSKEYLYQWLEETARRMHMERTKEE